MRNATLIAALLTLLLTAVGCRSARWEPPRAIRVAVMPFAAPEQITERRFEIRGWWFGAHDVRQNPNVGNWMAESLNRELMDLAHVEVIPHHDLRRYLLGQERRLRQAFPQLTEEETITLLREIPLSDYGRDLEVDKIIMGQVVQAQTSHNRTVQSWVSTVECRIQVWDVDDLASEAEGQGHATAEWDEVLREREWYDSWLHATDLLCAEVAERLEDEYFDTPSHFTDL